MPTAATSAVRPEGEGVASGARNGNDTINACITKDMAKRSGSEEEKEAGEEGGGGDAAAAAVAFFLSAADCLNRKSGRKERSNEAGTPMVRGRFAASVIPLVIQIGGRKSTTLNTPAMKSRVTDGATFEVMLPVRARPAAHANPNACCNSTNARTQHCCVVR